MSRCTDLPLLAALLLLAFVVPSTNGQVSSDAIARAAESQTRFLREHCHSIHIDGEPGYADLEFLRKVLRGKRVVLLGESNHGSREFNLQNNILIRFLHEKLGYRVLLLESGMGQRPFQEAQDSHRIWNEPRGQVTVSNSMLTPRGTECDPSKGETGHGDQWESKFQDPATTGTS